MFSEPQVDIASAELPAANGPVFAVEALPGKYEDRAPTITEIRVIDTYWSDHCRHTTFGTVLENIEIDDSVVAAAIDRYLDVKPWHPSLYGLPLH